MPSQSNYDELPSYQRTWLRQVAAAVIRSMPRTGRQTEAMWEAEHRRQVVIAELRQERPRRVAKAGRAEPHEEQDVSTEPRRQEEPRARRALPHSPHHSFDEAGLAAERLREELRRDGRSER